MNLGYTDATQTPVVIAEYSAAFANRVDAVRQQVSNTPEDDQVAKNTLLIVLRRRKFRLPTDIPPGKLDGVASGQRKGVMFAPLMTLGGRLRLR